MRKECRGKANAGLVLGGVRGESKTKLNSHIIFPDINTVSTAT